MSSAVLTISLRCSYRFFMEMSLAGSEGHRVENVEDSRIGYSAWKL